MNLVQSFLRLTLHWHHQNAACIRSSQCIRVPGVDAGEREGGYKPVSSYLLAQPENHWLSLRVNMHWACCIIKMDTQDRGGGGAPACHLSNASEHSPPQALLSLQCWGGVSFSSVAIAIICHGCQGSGALLCLSKEDHLLTTPFLKLFFADGSECVFPRKQHSLQPPPSPDGKSPANIFLHW